MSEQAKVLTKDEFFAEGGLKTEVVELSKGKSVIVSEIGGSDYIKLWGNPSFQKKGEDGSDTVDMSLFTPALIAYAVVDASGNRLFTDEDIPRIARLAQGPFQKVSEVARKLNGLSGEEVKNFEAGQEELNFSGSASSSDSGTLTS